MNSRIYNIVYSKLVHWLTPAMMRKPVFLSWLNVCMQPVQFVYNLLLRFRAQKLYELGITPQVCYLEKLLNDQYDYFSRGIYIKDPEEKDPLYVFQQVEDKPVFVFTKGENKPLYIYTDGEAGNLKDDFIIVVPFRVKFNFDEMASLIKRYKLGSKQFKIIQQ